MIILETKITVLGEERKEQMSKHTLVQGDLDIQVAVSMRQLEIHGFRAQV